MGVAPSDDQIAKLKAFLIENSTITEPVPAELAPEIAQRVISKTVQPEPEGVSSTSPDPQAGTQHPTQQETQHPTQQETQHPTQQETQHPTQQETQHEATEHEAEQPAPVASEAVESLDWVTRQQQDLIESEIDPIRGAWREWLPLELDIRRPQWRDEQASDLADWLDSVIPDLRQPSEEVTNAEDVAYAITSALRDEPEMAALAARLTPDELAALINESLARQ